MTRELKIKNSISSLYEAFEKDQVNWNIKPEFRAKKFNINFIASAILSSKTKGTK